MALINAHTLRFTKSASIGSSPSQLPTFLSFNSAPLSSPLRFSMSTKVNTNAASFDGRGRVAAAAAAGASVAGFNPNIGEVLGEVTIFTAAGQSVMFKNLWDQNEGMAVVVLLRHFGCPLCWELAASLKESKSRFDSAGVKLIAIGVGTPDKARLLAERLPFPMDCLYADPECKAYDALGLFNGFGRTFFNPASAKVLSRFGAVKEAVKNYTIKATPDKRSGVLQQGGTFVFKGKELLYARKDEATGDHAPLEDIFDICCKVPVA